MEAAFCSLERDGCGSEVNQSSRCFSRAGSCFFYLFIFKFVFLLVSLPSFKEKNNIYSG